MRQLVFGQIGVGTWGQVMLDAIGAHPGARVDAVFDVDGVRAKTVAEKYGIGAHYSSLEPFLTHPGIEAVGVATPDFAHREPVVRSLAAGKHVLVQKPMATTVEDAKAIVAAQKESGQHLMVDFQHRWGIGFAEARAAARAPSFGPVVHGFVRMSNYQKVPMQNLSWARNSSVLWFLGTHTADLARYIVGSEVQSVFAVSRRNVLRARGVDTPDFFQSVLQFENGVSMLMENSWVLPEGEFIGLEMKLDLYGANECVRVNQVPANVIVKSTKDKLELPLGARSAVTARGVSIRHFVDTVLAGQAPSVTAHDGLMNTAILVAIERSVAEGRVVDLKEVLA
jgi:predicted dehydrogenase